jgi:hypothetical protein
VCLPRFTATEALTPAFARSRRATDAASYPLLCYQKCLADRC